MLVIQFSGETISPIQQALSWSHLITGKVSSKTAKYPGKVGSSSKHAPFACFLLLIQVRCTWLSSWWCVQRKLWDVGSAASSEVGQVAHHFFWWWSRRNHCVRPICWSYVHSHSLGVSRVMNDHWHHFTCVCQLVSHLLLAIPLQFFFFGFTSFSCFFCFPLILWVIYVVWLREYPFRSESLFSRAIISSSVGLHYRTPEENFPMAMTLADSLLCKDGVNTTAGVACMKRRSFEEIVKVK